MSRWERERERNANDGKSAECNEDLHRASSHKFALAPPCCNFCCNFIAKEWREGGAGTWESGEWVREAVNEILWSTVFVVVVVDGVGVVVDVVFVADLFRARVWAISTCLLCCVLPKKLATFLKIKKDIEFSQQDQPFVNCQTSLCIILLKL